MKKKEWIVISVLLALAFLLMAALQLSPGKTRSIRITVNGREYGVYSLDKDQIIHINDTNVCEIKDGSAHMLSAHCPDKLCMKQRSIDEHGGTIICLPNKVVIEAVATKGETEDAEEDTLPAVDAVT